MRPKSSAATERLAVGACAMAVLAMILSGTSATAAAAATPALGSWPYSNGDLANTRDAVGSTISSQNVATLKEAWTFELPGKGATDVFGAGISHL